jgi:hypothetical protein
MDDWVTDGDTSTGGGYLDDMSADEDISSG